MTVATGRTVSWLWFAVHDEGPGIADDDLPRVFDASGVVPNAGDARRTRERRTGLGLAIVRQIIESHGGHVAAYSAFGRGSTFVLWLPATDRADDEPPSAANPWHSP